MLRKSRETKATQYPSILAFVFVYKPKRNAVVALSFPLHKAVLLIRIVPRSAEQNTAEPGYTTLARFYSRSWRPRPSIA